MITTTQSGRRRKSSTHVGTASPDGQAATPRGRTQPLAGGRTPTGPRILVVDDDAAIRDLLREILTDHGYAVDLAANGAEALHAVRVSPPGAVLMDLMMPVLSGFEATASLKNDPATASIPIVAMSAGRTLTSLGPALQVDDYVSKPFDFAALLDTLKRHVPRESE